MNTEIYKEMLESGLISSQEYEKKTGLSLGIEKTNKAKKSGPGLGAKVTIIDGKAPELAGIIKKMGGEGYRHVGEAELREADELSGKVWEGNGYKCPKQGVLVEACPMGDIFSCAKHPRCQFASVYISMTGGRRGGNGKLPAEPVEGEEEQPETVADRMASSPHKSLQDQALAIAKMRRDMQKKRSVG